MLRWLLFGRRLRLDLRNRRLVCVALGHPLGAGLSTSALGSSEVAALLLLLIVVAVFVVRNLIFLWLLLDRVDALLEDAVVKQSACNLDVAALNLARESELGVSSSQTDHGLKSTHCDRDRLLALV